MAAVLALAGLAVTAGPGAAVAATVPLGFDAASSVANGLGLSWTNYANADGTQTLVSSDAAVNYQDSAGAWHPIDNTLVADPSVSGGLVNKANSWGAHFGASSQGVAVTTSAGSIVVAPVGGSSVAPVRNTAGDGVTYANVWPSTDLTYQVRGDLVKESILLKDASAGSSFSFAVDTGSWSSVSSTMLSSSTSSSTDASSLVAQADGSLTPSGALGQQLHLYAPLVVTADGDGFGQAHAVMGVSNGQLTVSIDPVWLAAQPASAFPIDIDPTIGDTNVTAYKSDGTVCGACTSQTGNPNEAGTTVYWRSVGHYDLSSILGTEVTNAYVTATKCTCGGTSTSEPTYMYHATALNYAGAIGTGTVLASGSLGGTTGTLTGSGLTSYVAAEVAKGTNTDYFGFRGNDVAGAYTLKDFTTTMTVTYTSPPSVSAVSVSHKVNGGTTQTDTCASQQTITVDGSEAFTLNAKLADPAGYAVHGFFQEYQADETTLVTSWSSGTVSSGGTVSYSVGAGSASFPHGFSLAFRWYPRDGVFTGTSPEPSGPVSTWCKVVISDPAPGTPTGVKSASPDVACGGTVRGDQPITPQATVSDPDGKQMTVKFTAGSWSWTSALTNSGSTVVAGSPIPAGTFASGSNATVTVTATNTSPSTANNTSAAASCTFTVNNALPATPTVSATAFAGTSGGPPVGQAAPVTIATTTDAQSQAWIAWSDAATPTFPALKPGTVSCPSPSNPTGWDAINQVHWLCPSGSGTTWSYTFNYVPEAVGTFAISAVAYDQTSNPDAGKIAGSSGTLNASTPSQTHAWVTDATGSRPSAVIDTVAGTTLTLSSAVGWATTGPAGAGGAMTFAGTGEADTANTAPVNVSNGFSVSGYAQVPTSARNVTLASQDNAAGTASVLTLGVDGSGNYQACLNGTCTAGTTPATGGWDTLAVVYDPGGRGGSQLRLYVNPPTSGTVTPAASAATVTAPAAASTGVFRVGRGTTTSTGSGWFTGSVQNPITYAGALTDLQLSALPPGGGI